MLIGAFLIFDKIMRKKRSKPEDHYSLHPFEKNEQRGYALYNDEERYVYYAVKEKTEDNCEVYYFKNCTTNSVNHHKISEILRNNNAPNFSRKSFYFNDKEIWKYLEKQGIGIRATIVEENLTQYKITRYSDIIAFIRKRAGSGRVYTMRTYEKNLDILFLVLFAIAKTNEKVNKDTKNEP